MTTIDMDLQENDQELLKNLSLKDKRGRTVVSVGLVATLFFEEAWTRSKREIIAMLVSNYMARFGEHLRFAKDMKGKIYPIAANRVPHPASWLPSYPDEGEDWYFGFHSGNSAGEAGEFTVCGLGSDNVSKTLGYFHVSFPLNGFSDEQGGFRTYILDVCEKLKPLSGYGGLGIIEPLDVYAAEPQLALVRALAERFPGLEVEARTSHSLYLRDGIKGVNWLTVLGDRWVQEMGGVDYLRLWVTEACTLYPYSGGVVIQAGAHPELGDSQANRWPMHYVKLAKALKKIRVKEHRPFHLGGANRFDHEATMKWLNRFDDH